MERDQKKKKIYGGCVGVDVCVCVNWIDMLQIEELRNEREKKNFPNEPFPKKKLDEIKSKRKEI